MKKLYTQARWKKYSARRQRRELSHRQEHSKSVKVARRGFKRSRFVELHAPRWFSLVDSPREAINFLADIKDPRNRSISINLKPVEQLSTDAIISLVSVISDERMKDVAIRGNAPANPKLRQMLLLSGFYDHVRSAFRSPTESQGAIKKKQSKIVESPTAQDLIHFAGVNLAGKVIKWPGVYRTLVECMSNTREHARAGYEGTEPWWAAVYCDVDAGKARFTFIDNGVGIFGSAKLKGFKAKFAQAIGLLPNDRLLKDLLDGRIGSRTGQPYRGKGLPHMYKDLKLGLIQNLVIISNDVHASIAKEEYRLLDEPFNGTLICWELEVKPQ